MAKFAVMSGNMVSNIIVADTLEEASVLGHCIQYTDENPAGIGMMYDEETGTFIVPPAQEDANA